MRARINLETTAIKSNHNKCRESRTEADEAKAMVQIIRKTVTSAYQIDHQIGRVRASSAQAVRGVVAIDREVATHKEVRKETAQEVSELRIKNHITNTRSQRSDMNSQMQSLLSVANHVVFGQVPPKSIWTKIIYFKK